MKKSKVKYPQMRTRVRSEPGWTEQADGWLFKYPTENREDYFNRMCFAGRKNWRECLAHQCPDKDYPRAVTFYVYSGKKKRNIYCHCTGCGAAIGDKLKTLIFLLEDAKNK